MKVAALISGGKDSCFNMMTCIAEGHEIIALANLRPENKDELDSYMYQTVGHHAIDLYGEAMNLPLYIHTIKGSSLSVGRDYVPQEGDEVEDLFQLLSKIKAEMDIEAVSVGAILSDYQRVRVENVCQRLGLKVLAFLWRRNQEELLKEMIACDLKAIIIKVAALGLTPDKHLGMELKEILPHMLKMKEKYGLNECGEGGEYETFVLDCPLFKKSIVIDKKELVIHSNDAFAPVGYLNLKKCHLEDKEDYNVVSFLENVNKLPLTTTCKWIARHSVTQGDHNDDDDCQCTASGDVTDVKTCPSVTSANEETSPIFTSDGVNFQVSGLRATLKNASDVSVATQLAMDALKDGIENLGHQMSDLTSISLYVQDMSNYALINAVYIKYFHINPPVRICIQVCLPPQALFQMDCHGNKDENDRRTMHVQSFSHWAPANIGPFSQAVLSNKKLYVSGTVALIPSNSQLITGGIKVETELALLHVMEKLSALWPSCTLAHCPLVNCYVTRKEYIPIAKRALASRLQENSLKNDESVCLTPTVQYCVVPRLPKYASVEWQVSAWIFSDSDEDVQNTQFTKEFSQYTLTFDCTWLEELFSCRIEVYSNSSDNNVKEIACNMIKEYNSVMLTHSKVCKKDLAKVFYPAGRFTDKELVESFSQTVPHIDMDKLPTFSFIPVISLEMERHLLVWCQ